MATQRGIVKKTDLMNFQRPRTGGIIALSLNITEERAGERRPERARPASSSSSSAYGKIIRFPSAEVRDMGRTTRASKAWR